MIVKPVRYNKLYRTHWQIVQDVELCQQEDTQLLSRSIGISEMMRKVFCLLPICECTLLFSCAVRMVDNRAKGLLVLCTLVTNLLRRTTLEATRDWVSCLKVTQTTSSNASSKRPYHRHSLLCSSSQPGISKAAFTYHHHLSYEVWKQKTITESLLATYLSGIA